MAVRVKIGRKENFVSSRCQYSKKGGRRTGKSTSFWGSKYTYFPLHEKNLPRDRSIIVDSSFGIPPVNMCLRFVKKNRIAKANGTHFFFNFEQSLPKKVNRGNEKKRFSSVVVVLVFLYTNTQ